MRTKLAEKSIYTFILTKKNEDEKKMNEQILVEKIKE